MIVCPTPMQMNDFYDLLGTPDAPVSKIASVDGLAQYGPYIWSENLMNLLSKSIFSAERQIQHKFYLQKLVCSKNLSQAVSSNVLRRLAFRVDTSAETPNRL